MNAHTLAARLKLAMKARGFRSGAALARANDVERQTVYYWLNGTTKAIDTPTLVKLGQTLEVRPEWLVSGNLPIYTPEIPNDEEAQIIGFFRRMSDTDRVVFMKMARTLASDSDAPATKADPFPKVKARA